jgi:hypothetical protein
LLRISETVFGFQSSVKKVENGKPDHEDPHPSLISGPPEVHNLTREIIRLSRKAEDFL